MRRLALALGLCLAACATTSPGVANADRRIEYYARRIERHPDAFALRIALAQAFLDKARETHDPAFLEKARAASAASLDLAPSLEGYKMEARIAAFRHRFDEALAWAAKAEALASADLPDGEATALKVEALTGLGRDDEARALLPPSGVEALDFHIAAARGHVLKKTGDAEGAARAFAEAARLAAKAGAPSLAGWAQTSAAAALIDAGDAVKARALLEAARAFDPSSRFYRLHVAELDALEGRRQAALSAIERLLDEADDPELRRLAFTLARDLGMTKRACAHFNAAERRLAPALAAGESFTRDELRRLYEAAGDDPDVARLRVERMTGADPAATCPSFAGL